MPFVKWLLGGFHFSRGFLIMENLKHTKGEWTIHTSEQTKDLYSMIYSNNIRIAEVKSYGNCATFNDATIEERLANEKLIATAPDNLTDNIEWLKIHEALLKHGIDIPKSLSDRIFNQVLKSRNTINKATK